MQSWFPGTTLYGIGAKVAISDLNMSNSFIMFSVLFMLAPKHGFPLDTISPKVIIKFGGTPQVLISLITLGMHSIAEDLKFVPGAA